MCTETWCLLTVSSSSFSLTLLQQLHSLTFLRVVVKCWTSVWLILICWCHVKYYLRPTNVLRYARKAHIIYPAHSIFPNEPYDTQKYSLQMQKMSIVRCDVIPTLLINSTIGNSSWKILVRQNKSKREVLSWNISSNDE